ncbi:hypothetical protein [Methylomonas koyamae]|uniref:hypothetical protein n=1 Tax=Methylomonas koyamae TaxID=702114 RepID=UPI0009E8CB1E|nr:hypothetical protein [Methylomonas koyamae]BBL57095.1 hypothetical protein MKFW12EY_07080 [Methylomonas koyamae]
MKMISFFRLWLAVCLFAVSTVSSAGIIWESTDGNVNFLSVSPLSPFPSSDEFGIFAADADLSSSSVSALYTFTGIGSYAVTEPFKLGLRVGSSWVSEFANISLSGGGYLLGFAKPGVSNTLSLLYGFDITPASNQDPGSIVPLPASIWFMTSALLGFLYVGRNKSNLAA